MGINLVDAVRKASVRVSTSCLTLALGVVFPVCLSVCLSVCFLSVCAALRVVDLVEHELLRDGRLGSVQLGGATNERRNHLLHHLVEEHVSQLGVEEGAKLEGDLRTEERSRV